MCEKIKWIPWQPLYKKVKYIQSGDFKFESKTTLQEFFDWIIEHHGDKGYFETKVIVPHQQEEETVYIDIRNIKGIWMYAPNRRCDELYGMNVMRAFSDAFDYYVYLERD